MPLYSYACSVGHQFDEVRSREDRARTAACPCGNPAERAFESELKTITIAPVPLNFFTQWSDVYPDTSPKEMAKRKDIERYDPTLPHKPAQPRVNLTKHLPRRVEEYAGATQRLLADLATPVPGEQPTV